jgi:hypothetical protein
MSGRENPLYGKRERLAVGYSSLYECSACDEGQVVVGDRSLSPLIREDQLDALLWGCLASLNLIVELIDQVYFERPPVFYYKIFYFYLKHSKLKFIDW